MITQEQFISSILYGFIGDAFGMPLDGLNPTFIRNTYPNGFAFYEQPQAISKHSNLIDGSFTDIGLTTFMTMDMLIDNDQINDFNLKRELNKISRLSSFRKHDFESNYVNFDTQENIHRIGLTNISRALPLTLSHLNDPDLENKLLNYNNLTHAHEDSKSYMLFHNMMLKNLTETKSLPHAIFYALKYLTNERDKEVMLKMIQEYQSYGSVNIENIEYIAYGNSLNDKIYSNYPFAIAASMNHNYSLLDKFLTAIYMGGATSFNCFVIGSIHGIINPDIEHINEQFFERLHHGNEIRVIDIYDLAETIYKKYFGIST